MVNRSYCKRCKYGYESASTNSWTGCNFTIYEGYMRPYDDDYCYGYTGRAGKAPVVKPPHKKTEAEKVTDKYAKINRKIVEMAEVVDRQEVYTYTPDRKKIRIGEFAPETAERLKGIIKGMTDEQKRECSTFRTAKEKTAFIESLAQPAAVRKVTQKVTEKASLNVADVWAVVKAKMRTNKQEGKMKLYELANDFAELYDSLDGFEGNEDTEQAWFDTLEGIEGAFDDKAENIAVLIKSLTADVEALKAEADILTARRRTRENKVKWLKGYLMRSMHEINRKKIETPRAVISLKATAESVVIDDENKFIDWAQGKRDDLLTYAQPKISKTAVKEALKSGEDIPARLEKGESVVIK